MQSLSLLYFQSLTALGIRTSYFVPRTFAFVLIFRLAYFIPRTFSTTSIFKFRTSYFVPRTFC
jgi:hypothetical protein